MVTYRIYPDNEVMAAIEQAAIEFEAKLRDVVEKYQDILSKQQSRFVQTERVIREEISI